MTSIVLWNLPPVKAWRAVRLPAAQQLHPAIETCIFIEKIRRNLICQFIPSDFLHLNILNTSRTVFVQRTLHTTMNCPSFFILLCPYGQPADPIKSFFPLFEFVFLFFPVFPEILFPSIIPTAAPTTPFMRLLPMSSVSFSSS